jgi:ParB family chromosome partitioning protein
MTAAKKKTAKKKTGAKGATAKTSTKAAAAAKTETAAAPEVGGVALALGDIKKGGTAKKPVTSIVDRSAIKPVKGFNPRASLGDYSKLAESIKAEGILSSLVVRPGKKDGTFDLIAGERRYRASEVAGVTDIPVIIRTDLVGDDARAKAVAVAENSEDGRVNLNPIEVGRVALELEEQHGWSVARIAKEANVHPQKVRRCLTLMKAPKEVQKQVEEGEVSMIAGIEIAKLDDAVRKSIKDELHKNISAADVKKLAKQAAKQDEAVATTDGKSAQHKTGKARDAALVTWKSSKDKQAALRRMAYWLVNEASDEDKKEGYYFEARGFVNGLLWDRGDIEDAFPPTIDPDSEETAAEKKAAKKALADWDKRVKAEAAKHTPDEVDEDEGDEE